MRNAQAVSLEQAVAMGKTACETCCAIANRTVYAIGNGGQYYHYNNACTVENMAYASSGTLAQALMMGYAPCPSCVSGGSSGGNVPTQVANYVPGTSGIRVYATPSGPYYHLSSDCAGSGASYITLETALNYGKRACPDLRRRLAERVVWATATSPEFHSTASHRARGRHPGLSVRGRGHGQAVLPDLPGRLQQSDPGEQGGTGGAGDGSFQEGTAFVEGTSGIGVYASMEDEYFHLNSAHAGSGAYYIPLERR